MLQRVRLLATLLGFLAMFVPPAAAQVTTGTIVGTVSDPNGIVPGATVTIREVNRAPSTCYVTDETGSYTAPFLTPGTYTVEVNVQGFKKWVRDGVILQVNQRARVDVTLEVGGIEETTTVTAEAPLLRTDSSEVGTVIEERAIKELPLNGRNFATLVYLTPGITPGQANENLSGASTFNPRGASNFNALGHQANANALADRRHRQQRVHVQHRHHRAVGRAGARVQGAVGGLLGGVRPRRRRGVGGDQVGQQHAARHGVRVPARRRVRRPELLRAQGARRPTAAWSKDPKPPLDRHQFGAAVGGPLVLPGLYDGHNRTFFFADYAGLKEKRGQVFVNTVPTALTRTGDFSDFRDTSGNLIPIYDPLTTRLNPAFDSTRPVSATNPQFLRDPFPGNMIPPNRINPVGRNVASIYPLPNGPGNFDNYTSTVEPRDHRQRRSRAASIIALRQGFVLRPLQLGQVQARRAAGPGGLLPADAGGGRGAIRSRSVRRRHPEHAADDARRRVQLLAGRCRRRLVNELRVGYARTMPSTFQSDFGIRAAESLGIRGINVTEFTTGLPNINIPDMTGISGGPAFLPVNPKQFHWQIEDALVWLQGPAQLKFGYRLVDRYPSPFTNTDTRGTINFGRNYTNNPVTNTGGSGHRVAPDRLHQQRRARLPARALHAAHAGTRPVHPGRLQAELALHDQRRAALRDLQAPRPKRTTRSSTSIRWACG